MKEDRCCADTLNRIKQSKKYKSAILCAFKQVFPEWEDLPTGHRLNILWQKIKEILYEEETTTKVN